MIARNVGRSWVLAALALVFTLVLAGSSQATTFTVNTTADTAPAAGECSGASGDCSLRQAIDAANANSGNDVISVPAGRYTRTIGATDADDNASGDFNVAAAGALTIQGATGSAGDVIISAAGLGRGIDLAQGGNLTLANLTLQDGFTDGGTGSDTSDGGGIYAEPNSTLTLSGARIVRNVASDVGGGIAADSGTTVLANGSNVDDNVAEYYGGGIAHLGALTLTNSTVNGNTASYDYGGGIYDSGTGLTANGSSVSGNLASSDDGGGIYDDASPIALTGGHVDNNQSDDYGGALMLTTSASDAGARAVVNTAAGPLTINGTTLSNNFSWEAGGAIYNDASSSMDLTNAVLNTNDAVDGGGAIWSDVGTLAIHGSTLNSNESGSEEYDGYAGAIYNDGDALTIDTSQVNDNVSYYEGGAIYNDGDSPVSITASTLDRNKSTDYYGGALYNDGGDVTIDSSHLDNNQTGPEDGYGGAIYNDSGTVTIRNGSTLNGNISAYDGGAIYNEGDAMSIADSHVDGNKVTYGNGGGIYSYELPLTLTRSSVDGNIAAGYYDEGEGYGGGIVIDGGNFFDYAGTKASRPAATSRGKSLASVTIDRSSVSRNMAGADGGGLLDVSDNEGDTIVNSTFADNQADNLSYGFDGGGIYEGTGTLSLTNDTVAGNLATQGDGGGIYVFGEGPIESGTRLVFGGQVQLTNTIVADNTANGGLTNCSGGGTYSSGGHNLEDDTGTTPQCNLDNTGANGDQINGDAKLLPLANNGGPTLTRALALGSPAIDHGDNGVCASAAVGNVDQRGVGRPQGPSCDVGAYELGAPVARDDSYTTTATASVRVLGVTPSGVLGNDSRDAGAGPLTAILNSGPSHGTVTLNPDGSFTYTPGAGFSGVDTYTYHANDGHLDSNVATVHITVTAAAVAPSRGVRARLAVSRIPRQCVKRTFRLRVRINTASKIRRITVNGRRIKLPKGNSFTIKVNARKLKAGRHHVVIRVTNASGTTTRRVSFRRCGRARVVSPRFTG